MKTLLEIKNVSKSFVHEERKETILDNFSLTCDSGELLAILGPTGCGKTTLLRMIAGLDMNYSGEILYNRERLTGVNRSIGMLCQHSTLFPWLTVEKNINFGLKKRGMKRQKRSSKVKHFIKLVGLNGAEKKYPHQLSGGMRMRTSLARSLAYDSDLLLLDEPFSSLDENCRTEMQNLLLRIWKEKQKTIIIVTHNREEARRLGTRIINLGNEKPDHTNIFMDFMGISVPSRNRKSSVSPQAKQSRQRRIYYHS